MSNYCDGLYDDLSIYVKKNSSAWTEVWTGSYCARASIMAPERVVLGRFFEIFGILGGAGGINNSISMRNF